MSLDPMDYDLTRFVAWILENFPPDVQEELPFEEEEDA